MGRQTGQIVTCAYNWYRCRGTGTLFLRVEYSSPVSVVPCCSQAQIRSQPLRLLCVFLPRRPCPRSQLAKRAKRTLCSSCFVRGRGRNLHRAPVNLTRSMAFKGFVQTFCKPVPWSLCVPHSSNQRVTSLFVPTMQGVARRSKKEV